MKMPKPPNGYASCRVHDGSQVLLADDWTEQVTHLVKLDDRGSNGGRPTLCGLTRFPTYEIAPDGSYIECRPADLPSWSMGGGVSGRNIEQTACAECFAAVEIVRVTVEPVTLMTSDIRYGRQECSLEGLPNMTPDEFVSFWLRGHGYGVGRHPEFGYWLDAPCRRIQWRYLAEVKS